MKFFAKHPNYSMLYKPENRMYATTGEKVVLDPIKYFEFFNCEFHTNNIDEIAFILQSSAYGKDVFSDIPHSAVLDGTWVKLIEKYIVHTETNDFELEKLKEKFKQKKPEIVTQELKSEPAKFEAANTEPKTVPQKT